MSDLFCTPEQGARLKELLPELESVLVWKFSIWKKTYSQKPMYLEDYWDYNKISSKYKNMDAIKQHAFKVGFIAPALTLQELRDIATITDMIEVTPTATYGWPEMTSVMDAPELAEWVIERLEEQQ
jgi:hypothetical protein